MIAAIVLAAGESRRMGYPKALLKYRGQTFLESILQAVSAVGMEPAVVVLGPDAPNILKAMDLRGTLEVSNPNPETGQIGSIKEAVRAIINRPVEAAVVWPVDQPHVGIRTVEALVERFRAGGAAVVIPVHTGHRGHPVLFARSVFEELLSAPADLGARAVVRADPSRVAEVMVEDPAVLEDIDTPEAYRELVRKSL